MKLIVLDTETTSLHTPMPVQVGFAVCDFQDLTINHAACLLVHPGEHEVDPYAFDVHKISTIKARRYGLHDTLIHALLSNVISEADLLIGFNLDFDLRALQQIGYIPPCNLLCLMKESKPHVKALNVKGAIKNPKLSEAFEHYTGKRFVDAHNAYNDAMATLEIFRLMREKNQLTIPCNTTPLPSP